MAKLLTTLLLALLATLTQAKLYTIQGTVESKSLKLQLRVLINLYFEQRAAPMLITR